MDRPWHPTYAETFASAGVKIPADLIRYALLDDPKYDPRSLKQKGFSRFDFLTRCLDNLAPIPGSLVYIDPVAPLFVHGNQNDANDVAISIHWLRRCGADRQITLICDANVAKLKNDEDFKRPQDRVSGSGAFLAYADTLFNLTQGKQLNDPRTLVWAPRRAPAGEMQLKFDHKTKLFVEIEGSKLKDESEQIENDRPSQVFKTLPPDGQALARDEWFTLANQVIDVPISIATFKRDIQTLIDRGLIQRDAWGRYSRRKVS